MHPSDCHHACLSCRTNTSYDRWLQALNAWTDISTRSRDTLRQLLAYSAAAAADAGDTSIGSGGRGAAGPTAVQAASAAGKWLVALARSLKAQLTEDSDLPQELQAGGVDREGGEV